MNKLLSEVLDAHGGLDRWSSFTELGAKSATGGPFWPSKGISENHDWGNVRIHTAEEWTSIAPYGGLGQQMVFTPSRVRVEDADHQVLSELSDPRAAFNGYGQYSYWDMLRRAYFNGYAIWTYLATPFMLAQPGVQVEESAPWYEDGEVWRALDVVLPPTLASHSSTQRFYFGPNNLLRRQDYCLEIAGGTRVAHYVSDHVEVQGLRFPTRRHAYLRLADERPDRNQLLVWIRFADINLR